MYYFANRAFGRNSKKNKNPPLNVAPPPAMNTVYSSPHSSSSRLSLRNKHHSPKRHSQTSFPAQKTTPQSQQLTSSTPQYQQDSSDRPESQQVMFLSEPFVRTALVKGSFKTIVQLPKYVDLGEWIALNVFEFFTNLNQFYGVVAEYVTPTHIQQ